MERAAAIQAVYDALITWKVRICLSGLCYGCANWTCFKSRPPARTPTAIGLTTLPDTCGPKEEERLSEVGKAIYNDGDQRKEWIHKRYDELDKGRLEALLEELDRQEDKHDQARECAGDFRNNRQRMRYAEFPKLRIVHGNRCRGGGLQSHSWRQTQAGWYALDRERCKRNHRLALLET